MTPDVSTFTVILGDPNSIFKSTMSIALPSDVILKSSTNLLMYKGALAGGSELNPTYTPAAAEGDIYSISTDGYINSTKVKAQDMAICIQNTPAATAETKVIVDANWNYIQGNIDEDEYSKVGHVHDVEVNVSTGLGGAVVPQGTITTPAINANTSMGSFSYVESGTCSFTTSSGSLGSALTTYSFDPDDPENLVFGSATLSYEKVDSVSFDATTQSFSAVVGANPTLASDPVFTGIALTPHTHNVAFNVSTGTDYIPGQ